MIDGKKETSEQSKSLSSSRRLAAILLLALVISSGHYLINNFNSQDQTLNIGGQILQLGENEDKDHDDE